MKVTDAIRLAGSRGSLAISATVAQTDVLAEGIYDLWSDIDCYIKIASTANDVTTGNGYLLRANNTVAFDVRSGEKIGGIVASGTGTLSFHRVG